MIHNIPAGSSKTLLVTSDKGGVGDDSFSICVCVKQINNSKSKDFIIMALSDTLMKLFH